MLLTLLCITETNIFAKNKKCGDYEYKIINGKAVITDYYGKEKKLKLPSKLDGKTVNGVAAYAFFGKKVTEVIIPESVKELGDGCFSDCMNLKAVKLPSSLRVIKSRAFSDCKALETINLKNIEKIEICAFTNDPNLKGTLDLKNVDSVGDNAFRWCKGITSAVFSPKLKQLGTPKGKKKHSNPFRDCKSLKSVEITDGNECYKTVDGAVYSKKDSCIILYPEGRKGNCVIETGTKKILKNSFVNCKKLETVIFQEGIADIPGISFEGCSALKKVVLSSGITRIPDRCFNGCKSLSSINLSGISSLGEDSFYNCNALKGDLILNNVKYIGSGAFENCKAITGIRLVQPSADILIGIDKVWKKVLHYEDNPFAGCTSLKNILIEGDCAYKVVDGVLFSEDMKDLLCCPAALTGSYKVPDGVVNILSKAFAGSSLSSITMSDTTKIICSDAFMNSKLKSIGISASVNDIATDSYVSCFYGCNRLKKISVSKDNPVYESRDGVLFESDNDELNLVTYPSARKDRSYTLLKNCSINTGAFEGCKYLREVYFTESTERKESDEDEALFIGCKGVKVYFPRNTSVDWGDLWLFEDCVKCDVYIYKDSDIYNDAKEYEWKFKLR